jgi:protein-disulfide isomerase
MSTLIVVLAVVAGCGDKKTGQKPDHGAVDAIDRVGSGSQTGPVDTTPLPGIHIDKLDGKQKDVFYKLAGSLPSPCGKAHSLRTSVTTDTSCKRAPYAARYIVALLEEGANEQQTRDEYTTKYPREIKRGSFKLDGTIFSGTPDAPVKLVEFFDYGCPVCVDFKPILEEAISMFPRDTVVFYKMYPLTEKHPDSMSAAMAAVAAYKQDKFKAMHDVLFAKSPVHKREMVVAYAKQIGLDMPTFEADYAASEAAVKADMAEGEANGVQGTPTLFVNGQRYEGPLHPRILALWIEEEIGVNR